MISTLSYAMKKSDQKMLNSGPGTSWRNEIIKAAEGKPSIAFINNDKMPFFICVGNLQNDSYAYSFVLAQHDQITLCPYAFPQCLSKRQIENGATVELSLITKRYHYIHSFINGNPTPNIRKNKIGCPYIKNKNKFYGILNVESIENGQVLNLNLMGQKCYCFDLPIGGDSAVKFGDTIRVDCNVENNEIYIAHNDNILQSLPITNESINPDLTKIIRKRRSTYP